MEMENDKFLTSDELKEKWNINDVTLSIYIAKKNLRCHSKATAQPLGSYDSWEKVLLKSPKFRRFTGPAIFEDEISSSIRGLRKSYFRSRSYSEQSEFLTFEWVSEILPELVFYLPDVIDFENRLSDTKNTRWIPGSQVMQKWQIDGLNLVQYIMAGLPVYDDETLTPIDHVMDHNNQPLFFYTHPWGKPKAGLDLKEMINNVHRFRFKYEHLEKFRQKNNVSEIEIQRPELKQQDNTVNKQLVDSESITPIETIPKKESSPSENCGENFFIHKGDYWDVGFQGQTATIQDSDNIRYIAYLLSNPGTEIHVFNMVSFVKGKQIEEVKSHIMEMTASQLDEDEGLSISTLNISDKDQAKLKRLIKDTIEDLGEQLIQAQETGTQSQIEDLQKKIKKYKSTQKIYNQKGNPEVERVRNNIKNRIDKGIKQINNNGMEELANHLNKLHKGKKCSYMPDPQNPIKWTINF